MHDTFLRPFHAHFNLIVNVKHGFGSESASSVLTNGALVLLSGVGDKVEKHTFEISWDETTQAMLAGKFTSCTTTFP